MEGKKRDYLKKGNMRSYNCDWDIKYGDDIERRTLNVATQKSWAFLARIISVELLRKKPEWSKRTDEQRSDCNCQISSNSEFSSNIYLTAVNLCWSQPLKWSVNSWTLGPYRIHLCILISLYQSVLPNHKSDQFSILSKTLHWFPVSSQEMAESFVWPSRPSISYSDALWLYPPLLAF